MKSKKNQTPHDIIQIDKRMVAKLNTSQLIREVDKRVRKVFALMASDSEVVRAAADEAMREYAEGQRQLFRSKGLNPDRANVEATVEGQDGDRTIFRIVKRNEPLVIKIDQDDGSARSVGGAQNYSTRAGFAREERRGKYNDAGLLIMQSAASADPSEVTPWGCACM